MNKDTINYNNNQSHEDKLICDKLMCLINKELNQADNKIWHSHPVWFLEGNPIVGYSKLKDCIRLMFWSGMSFNENELEPGTGKFKDASLRFTDINQVKEELIKRCLKKSLNIQWNYRDIYKTKGKLNPLKGIKND